jgi:hypothetical protein
MSNPIPQWLDDIFAVLPANVVAVRNGGALNPAAGAAATLNSPTMTVQKSGNFKITVCVQATTTAAAGHRATISSSGTDSFVSGPNPQVPAVADDGGTKRIIGTMVWVDSHNLARGSTVTYTASVQPVSGGDSVSIATGDLELIVEEL